MTANIAVNTTLTAVEYDGKKFVNLTEHPVNIKLDSGEIITLPPSGLEARVTYDRTSDRIGDISVKVLRVPQIDGLPAKSPGTYYIVSARVRDLLSLAYHFGKGDERDDVLSPYIVKREVIPQSGQTILCSFHLAR